MRNQRHPSIQSATAKLRLLGWRNRLHHMRHMPYATSPTHHVFRHCQVKLRGHCSIPAYSATSLHATHLACSQSAPPSIALTETQTPKPAHCEHLQSHSQPIQRVARHSWTHLMAAWRCLYLFNYHTHAGPVQPTRLHSPT